MPTELVTFLDHPDVLIAGMLAKTPDERHRQCGQVALRTLFAFAGHGDITAICDDWERIDPNGRDLYYGLVPVLVLARQLIIHLINGHHHPDDFYALEIIDLDGNPTADTTTPSSGLLASRMLVAAANQDWATVSALWFTSSPDLASSAHVDVFHAVASLIRTARGDTPQ